jgi:hypothetical protein
MSDEAPSAKEIPGTIPLFFYDTIGRIIPGALLIIGVLAFCRRNSITDWPGPLDKVFPNDSTAGYSLAVILLFLGLSYIAGILLAAWSFTVLENTFRKIPCLKLNIKDLTKSLGGDQVHVLQSEYHKQFGHYFSGETIENASFLCSYYLWNKKSTLGLMSARGDAEALSGRSLTLVSIILFLLPVVTKIGSWGTCGFDYGWAIFMSFVVIGAMLSWNHQRKKRVYSRYAFFLAVVRGKGKDEQESDTDKTD